MVDLRHLVVEGDLLVGRRLVGGEDTPHHVAPRGGAADVGELRVPEGVHGAVEVRRGARREHAEQQRAGAPQQRLHRGRPLRPHGVQERVEAATGRGGGGARDEHRREGDALDEPLLREGSPPAPPCYSGGWCVRERASERHEVDDKGRWIRWDFLVGTMHMLGMNVDGFSNSVGMVACTSSVKLDVTLVTTHDS